MQTIHPSSSVGFRVFLLLDGNKFFLINVKYHGYAFLSCCWEIVYLVSRLFMERTFRAFQGLSINEFSGLQFDHQHSFDIQTGEQVTVESTTGNSRVYCRIMFYLVERKLSKSHG